MAKHRIKLTSLDTVEIDTTPQAQEENKLTAIMAEMAEEARELLEEAKQDEENGEVRKAWMKEDLSRTLNYYFNKIKGAIENE